MKYFIISILLCCIAKPGFAVSNYITIQVNGGLNFDVNTASELENPITINNALVVKVLNNSNASHVYVRLSAWNYPNNWVPVNNYPLQLIWSTDTSPNATNIASTTTVLTSDQLLFRQPKTTGNNPYSFTYKLRLQPLGYEDYVPGNYNYTFMFTMTEP